MSGSGQSEYVAPVEGRLWGALLEGLLRGPAPGGELGEAGHGPTTLELADDVDEVVLGIDPQEQRVVDQRRSPRRNRAHAGRRKRNVGPVQRLALRIFATWRRGSPIPTFLPSYRTACDQTRTLATAARALAAVP